MLMVELKKIENGATEHKEDDSHISLGKQLNGCLDTAAVQITSSR